MKRLIATLAALLLTFAAFAQEQHLRIGVGGYPLIPSLLVNGIGAYPDHYREFTDLITIYKDYKGNSFTTGNISAEYAWDLKKWLTASISASTDIFWTNYHDAINSEKTDSSVGALVHVMGKARFNWVSREVVRMYSSISLGFIAGYEPREIIGLPGIQIAPVGIEIGRKIFGFGEIGFGTMYLGAMGGIGYRF